MTRRSWILAACAALALACGGKDRKAKAPRLRPGEIHVDVDPAGRIEVNEQEMPLDSLKALLLAQQGAGKSIFYTRQGPAGPPTPEQWIVFMAVSEAQLPIRFEGDTQPLKPTKLP